MRGERVTIDSMAFGGPGVARLDSGKVVLVDGAAPGDVAEIEIVRQKRTVAFARIVDLLEPSTERVEPHCELAGRCGGCTWAHLSLPAQRGAKRDLLTGELTRRGLVDTQDRVEPLSGGRDRGYRIRTRLHRRGRALGTMAAGTTEVIPWRGCPILTGPLQEFCEQLAAAAQSLPALDAELELYVDAQDRRGLLVRLDDPISAPSWTRMASGLSVSSLVIEPGHEGPVPWLHERSADLQIAFAPGVFVQANREMNGVLVERVVQLSGTRGRFVEAYAGAGNFTVHLARRLDRGWAAEGDARAVRALEHNLELVARPVNGYREGDAVTARRLAGEPPADVLVADPPRSGMKRIAAALPRSPARRVVMVSCHPMTAIRDLASLHASGYRVDTVIPLDVFPHTHHLEIVASLSHAG